MTGQEENDPSSQGRGKRAPRRDDGEKIVVRMSRAEKDNLLAEAGSQSLSTFVREKLKGGRPRDGAGRQIVFELHRIGKLLEVIAAKPVEQSGVQTRSEIAIALEQVRSAIACIAEPMPGRASAKPSS